MLSLRAFAAAAALAVVFAVAPAHASDLDACGNIDVRASATCTANVTPASCELQCTPASFQASCAGKLQAQCDPMCSKLPDVSCTGSCQSDCEAECNVKPPSFDCEGNCTATCDGDCSSKCQSSDNSTDCIAQCHASCTADCRGSCTGMPAEADCKGKCEASCQGSCKVDTNFDCQINCQSNGYLDCTTNVQPAVCKGQCQKPEGSLFCNGQFVDTGNNAQMCLTALEDYVKAHVMASGMADCTGNTCEAEGKVSCHCSTPARRSGSTSGLLALAGVLGLVGLVRMRRR